MKTKQYTKQLNSLKNYYDDIQIMNIKHAATRCIYAKALRNKHVYFIKIGEKVNKEIKNMKRLHSLGIKSISRCEIGTNIPNMILVTKYFKNSDYGVSQVDKFLRNKLSLNKFIDFQDKALNLLKDFYSPPNRNDTSFFSSMYSIRSKERLEKIIYSKCVLNKNLCGREFVKKAFIYNNDPHSVGIPSLTAMYEIIKKYDKQIPQVKPRIIHGDYHAPNISMDNNRENLMVVDNSDVRFGEDPCWDLGKWMNYITNFHRVVISRQKRVVEKNMQSLNKASYIEINSGISTNINDIVLKKAVGTFSNITGIPKSIVQHRVSLAKLVINISTLPRHMELYPNSVPYVLNCICSSYLDMIHSLA